MHLEISSVKWAPFCPGGDALRVSLCLHEGSSEWVDITVQFMMTSSNGNIFRVTGPLCGEFTGPGEFPAQRPVTWSFDVLFDLRLNKRLSKQPRGWWFEMQSCSLWRHCDVCYLTKGGSRFCWKRGHSSPSLYHRHKFTPVAVFNIIVKKTIGLSKGGVSPFPWLLTAETCHWLHWIHDFISISSLLWMHYLLSLAGGILIVKFCLIVLIVLLFEHLCKLPLPLIYNRADHIGSSDWYHYLDTLGVSQVTATHLKSTIGYRQVSNIRCTLVGNGIVVHSDVVGASPVGAALY